MINVSMHTQPDDESCGPTSLHAVYQYYGVDVDLHEMIEQIDRSLSGGTLAHMLGIHALKQGFDATLYIYNLNLYDLSWFTKSEVKNSFLIKKLKAQMKFKQDPYLTRATESLLEYLKLGGRIRYAPLKEELLKKYFAENKPIITALSATYLYDSPREYFTKDGISIYDDIRGTPCGHFVVLCGYDDKQRLVVVADPHAENPKFHNNYYKVGINRLIHSILLGVLTYDANLLIIEPKH